MNLLRIALAQMNSRTGGLGENVDKIKGFIREAKKYRADVVVFPELALTGYPPEDLLLKPGFIKANVNALHDVIRATEDITAVVGFVELDSDLYNSAAFISNKRLISTARKAFLPNYGVFDEYRYFQRGTVFPVYIMDSIKIGVTICEDIWYPDGPVLYQTLGGDAEVIININASPYHANKQVIRERMLATRAQDNAAIVVYVNMVGGQDELVFDGGSVIFSESGELLVRAHQFEEEMIIANIDISSVLRTRLRDPRRREDKLSFDPETIIKEYKLSSKLKSQNSKLEMKHSVHSLLGQEEELYTALVTGTRDYLSKNGFQKAVIGLSGGIDSSLVACIAVDALGKDNVIGVFMPSMYSSNDSKEDASELARNLGITFKEIPITDVYNTYGKMFAPHFRGKKPDITEENLQARIRGNILMGLSNKFGWLVLTTGNKSEMSVGYATLYGDMAGGYAVIKDVSKTHVYRLAEFRQKLKTKDSKIKNNAPIPQRVFTKPPTAELRPDQKDEDSLPPYSILDPILAMLIEEDMSVDQVIASGYNRQTVLKVQHLIDVSEYKRRQAPPGVKVTKKALGKDRRMPITNRYKES